MPGQSLVFSNPPLMNCPDLPARTGISAVLARTCWRTWWSLARKSGFLWAFDPEDGNLRWSGAVGPAGIFGGIEWGTATDGKRIYVAISNSFHVPTKLINSQTTANGGFRRPSMRLPERSFGRLPIRTMPPIMAR